MQNEKHGRAAQSVEGLLSLRLISEPGNRVISAGGIASAGSDKIFILPAEEESTSKKAAGDQGIQGVGCEVHGDGGIQL